jgi:glutamyl-tRNA synthetase
VDLDPALLVPKRWERGTALAGLAAARSAVEALGVAGFTVDGLEAGLRAAAEANGWKAGDLFMAIRVALTGKTATPPLLESMVILGRERTLERLDGAAHALEEESPT